MRARTRILCLFVAVAAVPIAAGQPSYSGQERRDIKALSAEEIESYRTGAGMGYAKAAELNHHPGPKHVLELAKELGLDARQTKETRAAYDRMHAEAVSLGERLIAQEHALDRDFRSAAITEAALAARIREIARLQGEIRLAHLKAHLETRALLTPAQIGKYDELRGYGETKPAGHDPTRHHGS